MRQNWFRRGRRIVLVSSYALALAACACGGAAVSFPALQVDVHEALNHSALRNASVTVSLPDGTTVPFILVESPPTDADYEAGNGAGGVGAGQTVSIHVTAPGYQPFDQSVAVPSGAGGCHVPFTARADLVPAP